MLKRLLPLLLAIGLVAAACGDDDSADSAPVTGDDPPEDAGDDADSMTGPAAIEADDQTGDGTTVTVASVDLPADGFVVIHADNNGAPGMILGNSDLLGAGTSTDIAVTLDTAIEDDATVWPMAHVDANANGEYEFAPPDVTTDVPATTADGNIAVLPIEYTLG